MKTDVITKYGRKFEPYELAGLFQCSKEALDATDYAERDRNLYRMVCALRGAISIASLYERPKVAVQYPDVGWHHDLPPVKQTNHLRNEPSTADVTAFAARFVDKYGRGLVLYRDGFLRISDGYFMASVRANLPNVEPFFANMMKTANDGRWDVHTDPDFTAKWQENFTAVTTKDIKRFRGNCMSLAMWYYMAISEIERYKVLSALLEVMDLAEHYSYTASREHRREHRVNAARFKKWLTSQLSTPPLVPIFNGEYSTIPKGLRHDKSRVVVSAELLLKWVRSTMAICPPDTVFTAWYPTTENPFRSILLLDDSGEYEGLVMPTRCERKIERDNRYLYDSGNLPILPSMV